MKKIGLLFDERLSHDRKKVFNRNMSIFKFKYSVDFLPIGFDEDSFIEYLEKADYSIVMIPWHLYFSWKKAANVTFTRIVGYFADQLLHFEFQTIPSYTNFILLDFYRFNLDEIEILLKFMIAKSEETELIEVFGKSAQYLTSEWYTVDQEASNCVDQIFENPILSSNAFHERIPNLRLYITALWLACFRETPIPNQNNDIAAKFILAEYHKRLLIQLTYTSPSLTSKDLLYELWPTAPHSNIIFKELAMHSDFLKIYHFPKTRKISITGLFLPYQYSLPYNGEVRGFWIENRL